MGYLFLQNLHLQRALGAEVGAHHLLESACAADVHLERCRVARQFRLRVQARDGGHC